MRMHAARIPPALAMLAALLAAGPALAAGVRCQVDRSDGGGAPPLEVPVAVSDNSMQPPVPPPVTYEGERFTVAWHRGNGFEPQSSLAMRMGDMESRIYDFTLDGHVGLVNSISRGPLRFQCWVE